MSPTASKPIETKAVPVPHARRGLSLGQLKFILAGLKKWKKLEANIQDFNEKHKEEIEAKTEFARSLNLYLIDEHLVKNVTNPDGSGRNSIPDEVLVTAGIPPPPQESCSYAELINPNGVDVDYFVSHFWGHLFERTVRALSNFADGVYEKAGKKSADDVVFWVCLFALNQHKAAEEVGETPEDGPFNAALRESRFGAVMVLDGDANPVKRIWCLFEINQAVEFGKEFRLIVDEGDLEEVGRGEDGRKLIERIGDELSRMRAYSADASRESDKIAIQYRVLNERMKKAFPTFKSFEGLYARKVVKEFWFADFDAHVGGLIAGTMLNAGFNAGSSRICMRAIGMGAAVDVAKLKELEKRVGADLTAKVETRFGKCTLAEVFSLAGRREEIAYVIDRGAKIDEALLAAAQEGHTDICADLLARKADIGKRNRSGRTALIWAADCGHADVCKLLLAKGANVTDRDDTGWTALHLAAQNGHVVLCRILIDNGAIMEEKSVDGRTPIHMAAVTGHSDACRFLINKGANIEGKEKFGSTPLTLAAAVGGVECCKALLDNGADINAKDNNNKSALYWANEEGYEDVCNLLRNRGADPI